MKRLRLAAWVALAGLGLVCGCANFGNGGFLSRFGHGRRGCSTCGELPGCPGGACDGGPLLGEPGPAVASPPEAVPPNLLPAPTTTLPTEPPRLVPQAPQAQPTPAGPTSRTRTKDRE